jgi:hypothetical protein
MSRPASSLLRTPGIVLGIGLGGFVDGIVRHQRMNTLGNGAFHVVTWLTVLAGLAMLYSRVIASPAARGSRSGTTPVLPNTSAAATSGLSPGRKMGQPCGTTHGQDSDDAFVVGGPNDGASFISDGAAVIEVRDHGLVHRYIRTTITAPRA